MRVVAALLAFSLLLFAAPADAAPLADALHVHVLLVVDSNDPTVGTSVQVDLRKVRDLLQAGIPEHRLTLVELQGDAVTPEGIRRQIAAMDVKVDDALVVYYAGHGAWYAGGHYLRVNGGQTLERKHLVAAMQAHHARLGVLLTDCCSTYVGKQLYARKLTYDPDLFRDLFFRHGGFVDVTAASKGQIAVGDEVQGGYFTSALVDALADLGRDALDRDGNGVVSWTETLEAVKTGTKESFARMQPRGLLLAGVKYEQQTPHVFGLAHSTGQPVPRATLRVGVEVKDVEGALVVSKVVPDTPAAWAGFRVGERIVQAIVPGDGMFDDTVAVAATADLRRILAAVKGSQVIALTTWMPGERYADGRDKRRDRRLRLSH